MSWNDYACWHISTLSVAQQANAQTDVHVTHFLGRNPSVGAVTQEMRCTSWRGRGVGFQPNFRPSVVLTHDPHTWNHACAPHLTNTFDFHAQSLEWNHVFYLALKLSHWHVDTKTWLWISQNSSAKKWQIPEVVQHVLYSGSSTVLLRLSVGTFMEAHTFKFTFKYRLCCCCKISGFSKP